MFKGVRILAPALVLVLLTVAAIAGPALAARGGRESTGPTIAFSPSKPVYVGTQYTVVGSGFRPNTWVAVGAYFPDTTWWASGVTDGQGNFSFALTATSAGMIRHDAWEQGNSGRFRLKTTATLTVFPTAST